MKILVPVSLTLLLCACNHKPLPVNTSKLIFKDQQGHILTEEAIDSATGTVNYELIAEENINPLAKELHEQARIHGQAGDYDAAVQKLLHAHTLQPDWPYPVYDLAFTYLLKADRDSALKYYRETDRLAPKGFFTVKTAVYALEGEHTGKFPPGTYFHYMKIEWANTTAEKLAIARQLTSHVPGFAPAWKELAILQETPADKLKTIATGLSKEPDADTKGILEVNQALALEKQGNKQEAVKLLGQLVFSADATSGTVELAKYSLKSVIHRQ